jgi:hypothetical protein
MSPLVDFYRGQGTDTEGRFLKDIWGWTDDQLEEVHDYIQWLFPLPEPSRFNPDAPLLTEEDITAFRSDDLLQANLLQSLQRMLAFLGLEWAGNGQVRAAPNFAARTPEVWCFPNHNWLRITRILHSLRLLGLEVQAQAIYEQLQALYSSRRFPVTADTFHYWTEAAKGLPAHG